MGQKNDKSGVRNPFETLPKEVEGRIYGYLPDRDLRTLSVLSKQFAISVEESPFWRNKCVEMWGYDQCEKYGVPHSKHYSSFKDIYLDRFMKEICPHIHLNLHSPWLYNANDYHYECFIIGAALNHSTLNIYFDVRGETDLRTCTTSVIMLNGEPLRPENTKMVFSLGAHHIGVFQYKRALITKLMYTQAEEGNLVFSFNYNHGDDYSVTKFLELTPGEDLGSYFLKKKTEWLEVGAPYPFYYDQHRWDHLNPRLKERLQEGEWSSGKETEEQIQHLLKHSSYL
eukprot:TRINITY_DN20597_c0_g1_i1.p1 TRINITY_DN20597_c0_g1~~TRINITY_DN20597_c0_g1_i1.p1  ORF type:complete len:284 (-),score=72.67 TRINITY_DN20597_c0_g1_i1:24-875(-)